MTTRTSSFIKSDSQYHRISKQMGGGFWESAVWEMQITRKRDGEVEDESRRGGGGEAWGGVNGGVCVCEPKKEVVRKKKEAKAKGDKQALLVMLSNTASALWSTVPQQRRSSYGPQWGSSHQLCHANFTLNLLSSQVGGRELCARWLMLQREGPSAATLHPHKRKHCWCVQSQLARVVNHAAWRSGDQPGNERRKFYPSGSLSFAHADVLHAWDSAQRRGSLAAPSLKLEINGLIFHFSKSISMMRSITYITLVSLMHSGLSFSRYGIYYTVHSIFYSRTLRITKTKKKTLLTKFKFK